VSTNPVRRENEDETKEECVAAAVAPMIESKPLALLQADCRSIYNKALNDLNLISTYNLDVVQCTESWVSEEISNAEVFRVDYTTFRRDRHTRGEGLFV
jgi:hypothetical protein